MQSTYCIIRKCKLRKLETQTIERGYGTLLKFIQTISLWQRIGGKIKNAELQRENKLGVSRKSMKAWR